MTSGGGRFTGGTIDFTAAQFTSGKVEYLGARFADADVSFCGARFAGAVMNFRNIRGEPPYDLPKEPWGTITHTQYSSCISGFPCSQVIWSDLGSGDSPR